MHIFTYKWVNKYIFKRLVHLLLEINESNERAMYEKILKQSLLY